MNETPTIHLWTPAEANLVLKQGVTKTVPLCRWLPGGTSPYVWQPNDRAKLQIRDAPISAGGVVLAEFQTTGVSPALLFDAGDDYIKWKLNKAESAAWTWEFGYYDLDVFFAATSEEITLLTGTITLQLQVSD